MSAKRSLERRMAREGLRAAGAMVPVSEMNKDAIAIYDEIHTALYRRQPVNVLAGLLALEHARQQLVEFIEKSGASPEDIAKTFESYERQVEARNAHIAGQRS